MNSMHKEYLKDLLMNIFQLTEISTVTDMCNICDNLFSISRVPDAIQTLYKKYKIRFPVLYMNNRYVEHPYIRIFESLEEVIEYCKDILSENTIREALKYNKLKDDIEWSKDFSRMKIKVITYDDIELYNKLTGETYKNNTCVIYNFNTMIIKLCNKCLKRGMTKEALLKILQETNYLDKTNPDRI